MKKIKIFTCVKKSVVKEEKVLITAHLWQTPRCISRLLIFLYIHLKFPVSYEILADFVLRQETHFVSLFHQSIRPKTHQN